MPLTASPAIETAPAILEIGILLVLAVAAGWVARKVGLPAVLVRISKHRSGQAAAV